MRYRVLVIGYGPWKDWSYFQEQMKLLASMHREITLVHGGDTGYYNMYVTEWCKQNPEQFEEEIYRKDVRQYGKGSDPDRDWKMATADIDEVWQFVNSPDYPIRPMTAIEPQIRKWIKLLGIPLRSFVLNWKKKVKRGTPMIRGTHE